MPTPRREIEAGDLYALLSFCSNEDLDPLVTTLVGRLTNFLDINEDYKKHRPCHTKYYRAIGDDLRAFGGNTFRNFFRGEGPPYSEIVDDVCKRLGVPFSTGQVVANERKLLDFYLEKQWEGLSDNQRDDLMRQARVNSKKGSGPATTDMIRAAALPFPGLVPMSVAGAADPAFSVTAPCVVHIAYLRRKILETWDNESVEPTASTEVSVPPQAPVASDHTEREAARLVVGDDEAHPVLSIAQIPVPLEAKEWRAVDAGADGISRLNPLLQAVPAIGTAAEVAGATGTRYMEVVVDGELAKAIGGGFRGWVLGPNGIESQALLFEPSRLAGIVTPVAIWQIASVVVAQKHLADISAKLKEIAAGIETIRAFQNEQRRSVLTGATRWFELAAESVLAGELSDAIRHQIENHEAELLKVQDHLTSDIRRESAGKIDVDAMFGSEATSEAIQKRQQWIGNLYGELLLCVRARACGWQLLTAFPGEAKLKATRRRNIIDTLNSFSTRGGLLKETDDRMRQHIRELSSMWNTRLTVNERKLELLEWSPALASSVVSTSRHIIQDMAVGDAAMRALEKPVKILAKVEHGRVVATCTA